jgi:hypothetical protein
MIGLFGALSSPAAPAGETEQEAMNDIREAMLCSRMNLAHPRAEL